jgi:predicted esterase
MQRPLNRTFSVETTMKLNRQMILQGLTVVALLIGVIPTRAADPDPTPTPTETLKLLEPKPLAPNAKVVTLWPAGSPMLKALKGFDQPEVFNMSKNNPNRIESVINIHNPSIEVHLAPPDKANGMAVIVSAGGGNTTCNVGPEGIAIADWLNSLGIHAFIERYRLRPYTGADSLADTQRCFRIVRANAKEWGIDPKRIGIMGFSAGGALSALVAFKFDEGKPDAADPIEHFSSRPDFTVLVYAGGRMDFSDIPKNAPPAFLVCAGIDDASHAAFTTKFYDAYFTAKLPVELHIYGHGGHAGGISPRKGIPFGTWHLRFIEWAKDLGYMTKAGEN